MSRYFHSLTLKTRVLLVVLALLVVGIWALAARVASVMQADLERMAYERLDATVSYVAGQLDDSMRSRLELLKSVAAFVPPELLADPPRLSQYLATASIPPQLFPEGVMVLDRQGVALADQPVLSGRVGLNLQDMAFFQAIRRGAAQVVTPPTPGKSAEPKTIHLAVPLHDRDGSRLGALVATIRPSDPGMFGNLEQARFSRGSYFVVLVPESRLIVSATGQRRVMEVLAPKGAIPLLDRRIAEGYEGTGITRPQGGIELLSSSRNLKVSGWIVIGALPAKDAFAPIDNLKRQIFLAALLLSLAIAGIVYFFLARQLEPLASAGMAMHAMIEGTRSFEPLPFRRDDEIGRLIQSFNRLVLDRQRLEEGRQREQAYLRDFFNSLPMAVGHIDSKERITFGNRRFFALDENDFEPIGRTLREVVGEQAYAVLAPYIQTALAGEEVQFERNVKRTDGTIGTRLLRYVPDRNALGEVVGLFGLIEDVTERKQAEAALQQSEERYRSLIAAMAEGLVMQDASGAIVACNKSAERILGLTEDQIRGRTSVDPRWRALHEDGTPFPGDTHPTMLALKTGQPQFDVTMAIHKPDGTLTWLSINAQPIFRKGELKPNAAVSSFHDITVRKQAEEEVRKLNNELEVRVVERTHQLEDAYKGLESFAYSVAHDLRSPLRGINGFATILAEDYADKLDTTGLGYLKRIRAGSERMGTLIDDLSTLTRVSRAQVERSDIDFSELVREVADSLKNAEPERNVEFVIAPNMSASADRGLLRIALDNLLGNAWKFTSKLDSACIEVGMAIHAGEPTYFVRDNGIGFDPAFAKKVFAQFERLHTEEDYEGTGVGLAIVDRVVRRHGGRIWAEAAVGHGATFYFTL